MGEKSAEATRLEADADPAAEEPFPVAQDPRLLPMTRRMLALTYTRASRYPEAEEIWRAIVDDQTRLIADGLKTPGHSVALVDISMMVAEEGVIRKLEARGLEVTGPDGR